MFETLLVVVLAAVVVVYAQVLWAEYTQQRSATVPPRDTTTDDLKQDDAATGDERAAAERAKVVQDLATPSARPLPPEERQAVYDTLQETDAEPSMTDAERDAIIKSLNQ